MPLVAIEPFEGHHAPHRPRRGPPRPRSWWQARSRSDAWSFSFLVSSLDGPAHLTSPVFFRFSRPNRSDQTPKGPAQTGYVRSMPERPQRST